VNYYLLGKPSSAAGHCWEGIQEALVLIGVPLLLLLFGLDVALHLAGHQVLPLEGR